MQKTILLTLVLLLLSVPLFCFTPQQIKNYLNQAIQALDSGNNTQALEQVDLAEDQLESITGTESADDEDDDEEEEEGEIEEGPGEDEDDPRDIDTNDEEDTP
jgi:ABC-type Zn2+ transport system substrate-binding protein/surface adhesin